jgi:hypothetical protein
MPRRLLALAGILTLFGAAAAVAPARAESRAAWFQSLRQPQTGMSCCSLADCHAATADWRGDGWWAKVDGEWMPVPKSKLLKKTSIDGQAYICTGPMRTIYCFVPPMLGM